MLFWLILGWTERFRRFAWNRFCIIILLDEAAHLYDFGCDFVDWIVNVVLVRGGLKLNVCVDQFSIPVFKFSFAGARGNVQALILLRAPAMRRPHALKWTHLKHFFLWGFYTYVGFTRLASEKGKLIRDTFASRRIHVKKNAFPLFYKYIF